MTGKEKGTTKLSPLSHSGPICALHVFNNELLLSGEGSSLKIYNYLTSQQLFSRKIFGRNKIHGIAQKTSKDNENVKLSIWGGRSLCITTFNDVQNTTIELNELTTGDWIMSTAFSKDGTNLYCLTAHNTVVIVDFKSGKVIKTKDCGEKSILYSGSIRVLDDKVLICSGTVMHGIFIWELSSCELLYNLTEHLGAIFGVESSKNGDYLVSCSDDRSIKIWSLITGELLATGWGHGSRIWSLNFYQFDNKNKTFRIFSASEDLTARTWEFTEGDSELKRLQTFDCHTGRNIWSGAVNDELKIGFTGGADGKIKIHDIFEQSRSGYKNIRWTLDTIAEQTTISFEKDEIVKEYFDFGNGLVTITSGGRVLMLKEDFSKWEFLFEDSRFTNFSLLNGFEEKRIIYIANKDGCLILMKFDTDCSIVKKVEIRDDTFVRLNNVLTRECKGRLFMLLESTNPNDKLAFKEIDSELNLLGTTFLTKPKDNKIIATSLDFDDANNYILIGSRFATIALYDLEKPEEPLGVWRKFVKGDVISSLTMLQSNKETKELVLFVTLRERDYFFLKINSDLKLSLIEDNKIQKGFLEGGFFDKEGDLLLYGFKSDSFFIWNETKQFEIMREICGGPHRQWSFNYTLDSSNNLQHRFIYTRASDIQLIQSGKKPTKEFLVGGLHGREIRSMVVVNGSSSNEKLLITGSEDTTIKLSTIKSNGDVKAHWSQRQHGSGLQSVHAVNDEFVLSSSAREELYLWRITVNLLNSNFITLFRTIKPVHANPDLRIMDFDTIEVKEDGQIVGFLLITVYSDSNMKVWYFSYEKNTFKLLVDGNYQTCCILSAKFITLLNKTYVMIGSTNGYLSIYDITDNISNYLSIDGEYMTLTNGDKSFEVSRFGNLVINQQLHQSSIKALDVKPLSNREVSVVTGGDDNALILTSIELNDTELEISFKSFESNAASSTITGVCMVEGDRVLVTSVDQIVRVWSTKDDELVLIKEEYTTVADTGCVAVSKFNNGKQLALIGGSGFSAWEI